MINAIVQQPSNGSALSAEHYQTFEMAKANDDILGGDDIAQIRSYAAFARAQAQAIHKSIATMGELEDVAQAKAEMTETSQTFAKVSVYADQRIGELLRELPKSNRWASNSPTGENETTKTEAIKESGMSTKTAYDLQTMAANPEVVEAVIAKAEAEGRVVSRKQVLDAIKERDAAMSDAEMTSMLYGQAKTQLAETQGDLESAKEELASERGKNLELGSQMESLKRQLAERPEPEVIEREVEVVREVVPEDVQRRIESLEYYKNLGDEDNRKLRRRNEELRKELDRARSILNLDETTREIQRDVQYLVTSTNQYVRHYGGLTWTVQSLSEVDGQTLEELRKAVRNLVTFANTLMNCLEEING